MSFSSLSPSLFEPWSAAVCWMIFIAGLCSGVDQSNALRWMCGHAQVWMFSVLWLRTLKAAGREFRLFVAISVWTPEVQLFAEWSSLLGLCSGADQSNVLRWMCGHAQVWMFTVLHNHRFSPTQYLIQIRFLSVYCHLNSTQLNFIYRALSNH